MDWVEGDVKATVSPATAKISKSGRSNRVPERREAMKSRIGSGRWMRTLVVVVAVAMAASALAQAPGEQPMTPEQKARYAAYRDNTKQNS